MRGVGAPTGPGAHSIRPEGVVIVGRHPGMIEQGVVSLAHEGYLGVAVLYHDDPPDRVVDQVAEGVAALEAVGRRARVLVLGGAVPGAIRPEIVRSVAARWPDLAVVEHHGSLNLLFEEVLGVLAADPR